MLKVCLVASQVGREVYSRTSVVRVQHRKWFVTDVTAAIWPIHESDKTSCKFTRRSARAIFFVTLQSAVCLWVGVVDVNEASYFSFKNALNGLFKVKFDNYRITVDYRTLLIRACTPQNITEADDMSLSGELFSFARLALYDISWTLTKIRKEVTEILRAVMPRGFTMCCWLTFPRCLSYGSFKSLVTVYSLGLNGLLSDGEAKTAMKEEKIGGNGSEGRVEQGRRVTSHFTASHC